MCRSFVRYWIIFHFRVLFKSLSFHRSEMVDWLAVEPMGVSTLFSSFCVLRLVPHPPPVLTPFVFLRFAKVCKVAADRFGLRRVSACTNLCACVIAAYADDRCKFDGRWCSLVMEDCIFFWLLACLRLISAMEGGCERTGEASQTENRCIKLASDVYCLNPCHFCRSYSEETPTVKDTKKQERKSPRNSYRLHMRMCALYGCLI